MTLILALVAAATVLGSWFHDWVPISLNSPGAFPVAVPAWSCWSGQVVLLLDGAVLVLHLHWLDRRQAPPRCLASLSIGLAIAAIAVVAIAAVIEVTKDRTGLSLQMVGHPILWEWVRPEVAAPCVANLALAVWSFVVWRGSRNAS